MINLLSMGPTRIAHYEDLLKYLADTNVPRRENHDERSVEIPVTMPPLSGTLFMRWERQLPYLQVLHPFILNVPVLRVREIETAITRVNVSLPSPGLGFHHDKSFLYMRRCMPVYVDGIATTSLQKDISLVLETARTYLGCLREIVDGKPGAEILSATSASRVTN